MNKINVFRNVIIRYELHTYVAYILIYIHMSENKSYNYNIQYEVGHKARICKNL